MRPGSPAALAVSWHVQNQSSRHYCRASITQRLMTSWLSPCERTTRLEFGDPYCHLMLCRFSDFFSLSPVVRYAPTSLPRPLLDMRRTTLHIHALQNLSIQIPVRILRQRCSDTNQDENISEAVWPCMGNKEAARVRVTNGGRCTAHKSALRR